MDHLLWTNHLAWERLPVSPDGRFFATATEDGETDFWQSPGHQKFSLPRNEKLSVTGVAFFNDGHHVVTTSFDKTAQIWDLRNPRASASRIMHSDLTGLRSVALSPDERRIAVGDDLGEPRKVKLFDVASEREVLSLNGPTKAIVALTFQRGGNALVAVCADAVFVWRVPSWSMIKAKEKRASRFSAQ